MDLHYMSKLCKYCDQIDGQEATLLNIQARFLPVPALPIYRLRPALELLSQIKAYFQFLLHTHQRDAMRLIRADWHAHHLHQKPNINLTWCCCCHASPCIYDWLHFASLLYITKNFTTYTIFFNKNITFFTCMYFPLMPLISI